MGLLMAAFSTLFIYTIVVVFLITAFFFNHRNDDSILLLNSQRVTNVVENYEILMASNDQNLKDAVHDILGETNVYKNWELLVGNINSWPNYSDIEEWEILVYNGFKYYWNSLIKWDNIFQYIIRIPSESIIDRLWFIMMIILLSWPMTFSILALIFCRIMTKLYRPLKETITNLESFTTNVNHEFKTTLTEIISSLELAAITKEYEGANEQSVSAARRLNRILDSLWVLINYVNSDYRKEKVDLIELFDESLWDYKKKISEKWVKIVKKYSENAKIYQTIEVAPLVLSFNNLMKNAIKFSKQWGNIEISIKKNSFSIKDYGIGIETENLDKIFDRYFRENYIGEGNGIGLSIIKRLSEIYNWKIDIQSKKDVYTKITIHF